MRTRSAGCAATPIKASSVVRVHHEEMAAARVSTVNVLHALRDGYYHQTAIDKRPLDGPVAVGRLGLDGDRQMDSSHGGRDLAVYVYAAEDAAWWSEQLGRDIPPGLLGENLRTTGLEVTNAAVGTRWRVGDVLLEVRRPRTPCENLSQRMGIERFHLAFNASGRVGAMCRVLETGVVRAGDLIDVELTANHPVTVSALATGSATAQDMQILLGSGIPVARSVGARAKRVAARG
jgi:MOSC domain-containing protein YiiM